MMLLLAMIALLAWFVLPVPLAIAVGRAFRSGHEADRTRGRFRLAV